MKFHPDEGGYLEIKVKGTDVKYKNKGVMFMINGKDVNIKLDDSGIANIRFEKSYPAIQYIIKIKDKGSLKNDQKLAFFY